MFFLNSRNEIDEKEIYIYDISTQRVNRLSGELSTGFVNVAEENSNAQDIENISISDSGIVEQMTANRRSDDFGDDNDAAESFDDDSESEPSGRIQTVVQAPSNFNGQENKIVINSGYSVIS